MNNKPKKIIAISVLAAIVIVVVSFIVNFFMVRSTKLYIDNIDDYYYLPNDTKDLIFGFLKTIVKKNSSFVPWSGAVVRDSSPYTFGYGYDYESYTGEFIVDIPEIRQSYLINFDYREDGRPQGGYAVVVSCLNPGDMIYPDFNCQDILPIITNGEAQNE